MIAKKLYTYFVVASLCYPFYTVSSSQPIVILCTAALLSHKFAEREVEYRTSLQILQQQPYPIFIVESHSHGPSFFDEYTNNVLYCHSDKKLNNKGVNEAMALKCALEHFNFDNETMIIKLTGRYKFKDFSFINFITDNPHYDAFVWYDSCGQVFTGCFAMRCKYMKHMLRNMDLSRMEREMINIEWVTAQYIKNYISKEKVCIMQSLGVSAMIFGDGSNPVLLER